MTDFAIDRGETVTFDVPVVRWNPTTEQFDPVPLSGSKAWFTIKASTRDADTSALVSYNTVDDPANIIVVGNPDNGILRVSIPDTDTDGLPQSYLPYDVQLKEADGTVTTIVKGFIAVSRDVTISTT